MSSIVDRCQLLIEKASAGRAIIGVAGCPGAGKSTLAASLEKSANQSRQGIAVVVPMDGYHLANEELERLGLLHLKGIPATFDCNSLVSDLWRLRETDRTLFFPRFDRSIESSIANAIEVKPEHKLIVVEGNYLLLEDEPWNKLRPLFDEVWFLHAEMEELRRRLIDRHMAGGRTEAGAIEKMESTDLPNARLIESTRGLADAIVYLSPAGQEGLGGGESLAGYRLEPVRSLA